MPRSSSIKLPELFAVLAKLIEHADLEEIDVVRGELSAAVAASLVTPAAALSKRLVARGARVELSRCLGEDQCRRLLTRKASLCRADLPFEITAQIVRHASAIERQDVQIRRNTVTRVPVSTIAGTSVVVVVLGAAVGIDGLVKPEQCWRIRAETRPLLLQSEQARVALIPVGVAVDARNGLHEIL